MRPSSEPSHPPPVGLRRAVLREAEALGFDAVGIARVDDLGEAPGHRLKAFLDTGAHGDMDWLAAHAERRSHPRRLWPEARTAIMLGMSYAPERDPLAVLETPDRGAVSVYAQGKDYHEIVKPRLKQLARAVVALAPDSGVKVFVDTAPLMEKPLAALAGLGWQGRHTNLVSRTHGSWLFLGAILTTLEITPDAPHADRCGRCRRCLDACPTDAFPAPYRLDARRCIAYLTIEHKGPIAREFRSRMGNRVFGCDDCLAVCPWNKFAAEAREIRLHPRVETSNPLLVELLALDDAAFRARFAGTPVKRTGRDRFMRNVLIAAGNSGNRMLAPQVVALLDDPSPLVRGAAIWATARLVSTEELRGLAAMRRRAEVDTAVREEWNLELPE